MVWPTAFDKKLDEYDAMELPGQQLSATNAPSLLEHALNLDIDAPPACTRLTGIMGVIGKGSNDHETIEKMIAAGLNVAVVNMTYGSQHENLEIIKNIKKASKAYSERVGKNCSLGIAAYLSGRKIRTGRLLNALEDPSPIMLKQGDVIRLTTDESYRERCTDYAVFVDYIKLADQINKGDIVVIDNENITLIVDVVSSSTVTCNILRGGLLGSYKDVYIPKVVFNMSSYSEKDKSDIVMLLSQQIDYLIAPYTHNSECILDLKKLVGERVKNVSIIAAIQTISGFNNFDKILEVCQGVLITRQELGTDILPEKLILGQKNLIARANAACVPVIVSSQLLSSMMHRDQPQRSEILDVANCIIDGADALMLTGETAIGDYPVESVLTLAKTCKEAESCLWSRQIFFDLLDKTSIPLDQANATAVAGVLAAQRCMAALMIVVTSTGKTAFAVARYRPRCPILAVTRYAHLARQMHIWRGVMPLVFEDSPDSRWETDLTNRVNYCAKWAMEHGFVRVADPVVVISGWQRGSGYTNTMKVFYATAEKTLM